MLPTTPADWPLLDERTDTVDYDRTPYFPADHDDRMPWVYLPEPAVDPDWQYAAESENAGPLDDDHELQDLDNFPDYWEMLAKVMDLFYDEHPIAPAAPIQPVRPPKAKKQERKVSTASHGQRPHDPSNYTVIVNGETRGPDWGIGRAAAEFARHRARYESIPKGRYVEYDLCEILGIPFKR